MPSPGRLAAHLDSSAASSGGFGSTTAMPDDLLQESCKRVGIAGLVVGGLWAFVLTMNNLIYPLLGRGDETWRSAWEQIGSPVGFTGLGLSIAMAIIARRWRSRPKLILDLGLVFEVTTAALIAFVQWWHQPFLHGGRVSWVGVLILVYPSIAPNTVGRTLAASFAAATTEVLAYLLAAARHDLPADATPFVVLWCLMNPFVCACLAVIPAKIIRHLGRQVTKARELGSYQLEELLGRGGMGEVYRASHRLLARPAAIKLIRPEVLQRQGNDSGRVLVERFRREADAAASLRSPHTIELYDFGITGDGTFFYVMEYLDGLDLDTLVQRFGPLPPERAAHVLRQICASLAEAHARGMVHRDIKPSNVHLCRLGLEVDFAKVLDFGLVKCEQGDETDVTLLTSPHLTTGTPAFMAPEAALDPRSVDHRADIYALGCVGYWLLTGKLVFEADAAVSMLLQHVRTEPQPPSVRLGRSLPEALEKLVMACLAKDRAARPEAPELERQLAALAPDWSEARATAWWQEHLPEGRTNPVPERTGLETATIMHAPSLASRD
jgi:serine/threonine-protein kinase